MTATFDLQTLLLAVVPPLGGFLGGLVIWMGKRMAAKLEEAHAERDRAMTEKLTELGAKVDAQQQTSHRLEMMIGEVRSSVAAIAGKIEHHDEEHRIGREARSRLHARLDGMKDRVTRNETKIEGAA